MGHKSTFERWAQRNDDAQQARGAHDTHVAWRRRSAPSFASSNIEMQRHMRAVLFILLTVLGSIPIMGAQALFAGMSPVSGLLYEIAIALPVLALWVRWQRHAWQSALSRQSRAWQVLAMAVLCNVALGAAYHWWIPPKTITPFDRLDESVVRNATIVITACVTGPLLWEALFRGFLLERLRKSYGPTASVLLSAIGFGIAHGELTRILQPLAGGVMLGAIVVCTSRLWLAATAHSLFSLSGLLEALALRLEAPERLGALYPALCLTIAAIAALELRRVLVTTRWFIAPSPASLVARPATWGLDAWV
jgi:membrane protease YdiL (CAAX protease family)